MQQERLFRLALEAIVITAVFDPPSGWRLKVLAHRQGEPWADADESLYWGLSSAELADVIAAEAAHRLGAS